MRAMDDTLFHSFSGLHEKASHQALVYLVERSVEFDSYAHICVVAAKLKEPANSCAPFFVEVTLARRGDAQIAETEDLGKVLVLSEVVPASEFLTRLKEALQKQPFRCCGWDVIDQAMVSTWRGNRYGAGPERKKHGWPFMLVGSREFQDPRRPYPTGHLFAPKSGKMYTNFDEILNKITGREPIGGGIHDLYPERFNIRVFDYRGRIAQVGRFGNGLRICVEPSPVDPLEIFGIVRVGDHEQSVYRQAPGEVDLPLELDKVRSVSLQLKLDGDIIDSWMFPDPLEVLEVYANAVKEEASAQEEDGGESVGGGGSSHVSVACLSENLGFLRDKSVVSIINRDLEELEAVLRLGLAKSSLMLAGSILEGILFDVTNRNPALAGSFLEGQKGQKKWPKDASLPLMIDILLNTALENHATGEKSYIFTKTVRSYSITITDHRDLIHPHAEMRTKTRVNKDIALAMAILLRLVVLELEGAGKAGLLDLYEKI
jgi:hypothetical protein